MSINDGRDVTAEVEQKKRKEEEFFCASFLPLSFLGKRVQSSSLGWQRIQWSKVVVAGLATACHILSFPFHSAFFIHHIHFEPEKRD